MELRPGFPVDLIVWTPEKVRQRLEMGDCFMREIVEEGKVLYEATVCNNDKPQQRDFSREK